MIDKYRLDLNSNTFPNFVGAWSMPENSVCDQIVDFFESNKQLQKPGKVSSGAVNTNVKKSTDIKIEPKYLNNPGYEPFIKYFEELHLMFKDYCDQWKFLKTFVSKMNIGSFNLQKYELGGHFSTLHSERTGLTTVHRILVWMTYLNDVESGGETEFPHFDIKVKPSKGTTLIWPAEWTHAHLAKPIEEQPKYIITGWMHINEQK